jgi:hypothetical protein
MKITINKKKIKLHLAMGRKDVRQKRHQQKKAFEKQQKEIEKKRQVKQEKKTEYHGYSQKHINRFKSSEFQFLSHFYPEHWLEMLVDIPLPRCLSILRKYFPILCSSAGKNQIITIASKYCVNPAILGTEVISYSLLKKSGKKYRSYLSKLIKNDYESDLDEFLLSILRNESVSAYSVHLLPKLAGKLLRVCSLQMMRGLMELLKMRNSTFQIKITDWDILYNDNIEIFRYFVSQNRIINKKNPLSYENANTILNRVGDYTHIARIKGNANTILDFLIENFQENPELEEEMFRPKKQYSIMSSSDPGFYSESDEESLFEEKEKEDSSRMKMKPSPELEIFNQLVCRFGSSRHLDYLLTKVKITELASLNIQNLLHLAKTYPEEIRKEFLGHHGIFLISSIEINLEQLEEFLSYISLPMDFILEKKYFEEYVKCDKAGKITKDIPLSTEELISREKEFYQNKRTIFNFLVRTFSSKYTKSRMKLIDDILEKYFPSNELKNQYLISTLLDHKLIEKNLFEQLYFILVCSNMVHSKVSCFNLSNRFESEIQKEILKYFIFDKNEKLLYFQLNELIKMLCSKEKYFRDTTDKGKKFINNVFELITELHWMVNTHSLATERMNNLYIVAPKSRELLSEKVTWNEYRETDFIYLSEKKNEENFNYYSLSIEKLTKKYNQILTKTVVKYCNIDLYEKFTTKFPLKKFSFKLVEKNRNINVLNKYLSFQASGYLEKKKEIKKVLKQYSSYITYKFKEVEIDNQQIIKSMYMFVDENVPVKRKVNYPFVLSLFERKFDDFFHPKLNNGFKEHDLYNLLFIGEEEGGSSEEKKRKRKHINNKSRFDKEGSFELLKLCSSKFSGSDEGISDIDFSNLTKVSHPYFSILIKVCFRLRNSKFIRYLKSTYESDFRKHFKEEYLAYNIDIDLFEELEKEGYFSYTDEFLWNYLISMERELFRYHTWDRESIKQSDIIKFLEYLIYERSTVEIYSTYIKAFLDQLFTEEQRHRSITNSKQIMFYLEWVILSL